MRQQQNAVLKHLKQNYYPFTYLSDDAFGLATDALRIFHLCVREKVVFPAGEDDNLLFLALGEVVVSGDKGETRLKAGDGRDAYRLVGDQGEVTVQATEETILCHGAQSMIDDFLILDELGRGDLESQSLNASELLLRLRNTKTFRTLPVENAYQALNRMKKVPVAAGADVVRQYAKGDAYYIINAGTAEVWREELDDDEPQMVATLRFGDAFGEESLVMSGARNATVKMITDGEVLRLDKEDFDELISMSLVDFVTPAATRTLVDGGGEILDVRYEEEYEESFIPGSTLIPLPDLRARIGELEEDKTYLVLCKKGSRAAAATLLLKQRGFDAKVIEGGIVGWPYETSDSFDLELVALNYCPFAQRALITMLHNNIPHKLTYIDPDNKPDWFHEISPVGKVPILRINDDDNIFESTVINEFVGQLAGGVMLPDDPVKRTRCRSWIEFAGNCQACLTKVIAAGTEQEFQDAKNALAKELAILEEQVDKRGPFFLGENFSLADSTYAPFFLRLHHLGKIIDAPELGERLSRWSDALLSHEPVQQATPDGFTGIFRDFITRKGKGGYLDTLAG